MAAATPLPDGPDGPNVAVAACAAIGLKLAPVKDGLEKAALNNLMSKPLLFNQSLLIGLELYKVSQVSIHFYGFCNTNRDATS